MVPSSFDESNAVLSKPDAMPDDQCSCLSVLLTTNTVGTPVVLSCWKLTAEERDEILRTGRVWLTVVGETMPPVALDGIKPIVQG
jgi:hypothetical protein